MCGIFAILNYEKCGMTSEEARRKGLALSKLLRHRGPDWSGCVVKNGHVLCHERLAIVGVESGSQPLTNSDETLILSVNGEIYNHLELKKHLKPNVEFKTHSDCEIIIHLYEDLGPNFINLLQGMFSFVLVDVKKDVVFIARDPIGITSLYTGRHEKFPNTLYVASEMKALQESVTHISTFPPGHIYSTETGKATRYFNHSWLEGSLPPFAPCDISLVRRGLETAVRRRLMADVPFGVLLSGGLDSSLIASITVREAEKILQCPDEEGSAIFNWPKVHSFSIGLAGSPDLKAAAEVAQFIGTKHHGFVFTLQEAHDALPDVIYHLETYDVTTIRASTPMYLLSRRIKAFGVKMVLSGEGSDEIFGGYLYFHAAPNPSSFHKECVDRVKNLHLSDCLRANKSTMAWGLEARVPFLDTDFLNIAMNIGAEEKMFGGAKMEKYILRKAFDDEEEPYLPHHILWRQKEQFSDGVGYSWIDSLKQAAESKVTDEEFENRHEKWTTDVPDSKEAYWYRSMFDSLFPNPASESTVQRWIPRSDWGCSSDPSGRAQKVHCAAYGSPTQNGNGNANNISNE